MNDPVNSPSHYKGKNGMESIDVIEAFGLDKSFCLGNVVKYVLRAGKKGDAIQDLKKARWYLNREIARMEMEKEPTISQESKPMNKTTDINLYRSGEIYPCRAAEAFCKTFFYQPYELGWSTLGECDPEDEGYIAKFKRKDGRRIYLITGKPGNWSINLESSVGEPFSSTEETDR